MNIMMDLVGSALVADILEEAGPAFADRHIGSGPEGVDAMLARVGMATLDELADLVVPSDIRLDSLPDLPLPLDETSLLADLRGLAAQNQVKRSLIGQGYYGTNMPPVILRNVLQNPAWYTAYTPYQAELSQGRLEALLLFQTVVTELTGLPFANASLLDEGTAVAEAVGMAFAATKGTRRVLGVANDLHPQTRDVVATRAASLGIDLVEIAPNDPEAIRAAGAFALILQYPGTSGEVRPIEAEIAAIHEAGGIAIVATDLLALALLRPPGEMGADIVVGSAQRFGVPMGFGGPHAAFLGTTDALKRLMPGRLVGVSRDASGAPALRLALQTREQHIRREKATSNICTAQVLLAVLAAFYAVWHGPSGLRTIARRVSTMARLLAGAAVEAGFTVRHLEFFDTIVVEAGGKADRIMAAALAAGFNLRRIDAAGVAIAFDETVSRDELVELAAIFGGELGSVAGGIPAGLLREGDFLPQEQFHAYRTEHEMLRYLKRLADKDVALDRGMIPLGSCTMKLNATIEMLPVTWPEFADLHPFVPRSQSAGTLALIARLESYLCTLTGLAAASLQPNAGSQGEYAGLLAVRAYHAGRGEDRRVCLIPTSAHGTNPASAAMAGLQVVGVACDRAGNVDLTDLDAKLAAHPGRIACLMITYPSNHGVFETAIRSICAKVHAAGGQVYMDGANFNAQAGLTSVAAIGADLCHLNLHKTFCIPHGGGGPGVGPVVVAAHLAPYLPRTVASAPFGSALILPISYAYIRLMGAAGLKYASQMAILNANYIASRVGEHFPVLYRGDNGLVAHECILDCRGFEVASSVTVEDIAKRLQDFGFHAPTMSWPVPGTLMVEPTESESKAELDRFCDAMIAIAAEIAAIKDGRLDRLDNPLKQAPHTASEIARDDWPHPYGRMQAAYPLPFVRANKYWPPVRRVDNVYGDRNLFCSCA